MKMKWLQLIVVPLLSSLLLSGLLPIHTLAGVNPPAERADLLETAEHWKEQLAQQDQFQQWQAAKLSISALGPGTHSWLALVTYENEVIGYMIIHALEQGGYELGEYGVGDVASLQYLADNSNQLIYYGPFHSIIKQEIQQTVQYIEPFLQEAFPIDRTTIEQAAEHAASTKKGHGTYKVPALITGADAVAYFSPYAVMPWLTTKPLNNRFEDDTSIEVMIELGSKLRYTTESWNHTIFSVYAITGYHEWNEFDLYIALQDENESLTRFIPYEALMLQGSFYDQAAY